MKKENNLFRYVELFFQDYLPVQKGVSNHTIHSYRDALKLFFQFISSQVAKRHTDIKFTDLTSKQVLEFLKNLETTRKNNALTRNHRLTALKTFFSFLASQDLLHASEYQKITSIPLKRAEHKLIDYLEIEEVKSILNGIDRTQTLGERDYVLISLMYNTGARVQEICDLKTQSLRLGPAPSVFLTGKGKKTRQVPLWSDTAKSLVQHIEKNYLSNAPEEYLFKNRRGEPISRFGVRSMIRSRVKSAIKKCPSLASKQIGPHTFRHSTAMHLLQSGIDLSVIKTWLGHVSLSTTHIYVDINLEMKRKALEKCSPLPKKSEMNKFLKKNKDVIAWLETL